jgi:arginyl-tRNA synthetase
MTDFRQLVAGLLFAELGTRELTEAELASFLEQPPKQEMGDWALPCFRLAKQLKKSPDRIAAELQQKLVAKKIPEIEKIEALGGYLNFFVQKKALAESVLKTILQQKQGFGDSLVGKGKRAMVEYSGPNTNKPLHIGHLRNQSIGMALIRCLEANGYKVVKANILNNRGVAVCKSMLAYQKWGKGETPESTKKKPDHFVGDWYVRFSEEAKQQPGLENEVREMLQQWEKGDKKVRALWKKMDSWELKGLHETYQLFGSEFDVEYKESDFYDKATPWIEKGLEKGVLEREADGSVVARLEKHGLSDKIVLRSDGTSIYLTQDLALTPAKFNGYKLDKAYWVVATEQDLYFRQLFKIFELLGEPWAKNCVHVSYGLVMLPSGRLKSREGKTADADDLIAEMKKLALEEIKKRHEGLPAKETEKRALAIALAGIKFFLLKTEVQKNVLFNPEESLSFEGETGPYVLYSYARAKSILRKIGKEKKRVTDFSVLQSSHEKRILNLLQQFPEIVQQAPNNFSLHSVAQFLLELSAAFNSFYHELPVLQADEKTRVGRLALVEAVAIVLQKGLRLLDIHALEQM